MFWGDFMPKNSRLNVHKWYVNKNRSSVIKFMHSLSFCQQNVAKSIGHFSKMDGDLSKHLQGFAIQIIQPHASRGAQLATGPAGRNQLLSLSFRGCVTEPHDGNMVPFIHAYSYTCTRGNIDGFYRKPQEHFPLTTFEWTTHYTESYSCELSLVMQAGCINL